MSVGGIDLGTGKVKVARLTVAGTTELVRFDGQNDLTSCVFFGPSGGIVLGEEAFNLMLCDSTRGVLDWKRHMGTDDVLYRDEKGQMYYARHCARIYLEACKTAYAKETGEILKKAVISVPANYNDRQKAETREAAEACGIEVLRLVHEPTAALIGNEVTRRGDGWYVVVDVGHGTIDVSVARCTGNEVEIKTTSGIPKCGGTDYTARLLDCVNAEFTKKHGHAIEPSTHSISYQELYQRCIQAKHSLSIRESTSIVISADGKVLTLTVTRQQFADLTRDLTEQICDCVATALKDAGTTPQDIREFIPAGGGSLVHAIGETVQRRFGKPFTSHTDVHFAVARGAVIMARMEEEAKGNSVTVDGRRLPPCGLSARDVTAHPIGVAVITRDGARCVNSVILQKGVAIPGTKTCLYELAEPGQTTARVEVLQGSDGAPKDQCLILGHFDMVGLQPVHDKPHRLDIRLSLNRDGVLTAVAYYPLDGTTADMKVDYKKISGT